MKVIYKYPLPLSQDDMVIRVPEGAQMLTVQMQVGFPYLWAAADKGAPEVSLLVTKLGTGWNYNSNPGLYLGTVQDGSYVWHYFAKPVDSGTAPNVKEPR